MSVVFTILFAFGAITMFRKTAFNFGVPILGRMLALAIGGIAAVIAGALIIQFISLSGWIYLAFVLIVATWVFFKGRQVILKLKKTRKA